MSATGPIHVGIYGELDMNLVDGSSIWLGSVAETLAGIDDVTVTVLLRTPVRRDVVVAPLRVRHDIRVIDPGTRRAGVTRLDPAAAAELLAELDAEQRLDVVLLRGPATADAVVASGRFDGRIWLYHVPLDHLDHLDQEVEAAELRRRASACHRLLCQTEAVAARVNAAVPDAADRLLLLPPLIPDELAEREAPSGPLKRLLYAGKFSPEYFFPQMVSLFARLRADLPGLEWSVAGDKIHNPPDDPEFRSATQAALEGTPGLRWHGAVSRQRVHELLLEADTALSLRHPALDASSELSTKVLEYGAAGTPALLNRNPLHAELLGEDYPLLAGDLEEARLRLLAANADADLRAEAQRRCRALAERHTFSHVAATLAPHLRSLRPAVSASSSAGGGATREMINPSGSPRLLLAGHQFNFLGEIRDFAIAAGAAVREDRWAKHAIHDEAATARAAEWAEVIHCEWCLGAAIWFSHHKRDDQRLVVRFHRMELETPYPGDVDLSRVDAMVFVARHVLEAACEQHGWPLDHPALRVIPNAIDTGRMYREKLPGAQFTLGLIGWVPMLKRLDRALEILQRLRVHDDRYRLIVKGNGPWHYYWVAVREAEQRFQEAAVRRVERSPLLRAAVTFEPFGEDIAEFLQKVGWILSVSNIEGHAVAPAEGMASGALPVVLDRPGARQQYPADWVHPDPEHAARMILATGTNGGYTRGRERALELAAELDWGRIAPLWRELLALR